MKRLTLFVCALWLASVTHAQLTPKVGCATLMVDVLNGTVNGYKANTGGAEFAKSVPCSTGSEQGPNAKCGAVIYYKDKDVAFYADRKYFEIGSRFKGKISLKVLGTPRNSLYRVLGAPKLKDALWDAFETQYGTLVLHYTVPGAGGRVKTIQMSTLTTDELSLCE